MVSVRAFKSVLLTLITLAPIHIPAQDTVVVRVGDVIRFPSASLREPAAVSVIRLEHDSVVLRRCVLCGLTTYPEFTPVEARRISRGGHGLLGAGVGLLTGAFLGALIIAPCPHGNVGDGPPCGFGQAEWAFVGGFGGLLLGAIVGSRFLPTERWLPARWP
jgi:hypothetical protein